MEGRLKLRINPQKSAVDRLMSAEVPGVLVHLGEGAAGPHCPKSLKRFKERVRQLTARRWSISLEERIRRVNAYLRGWLGYFRLADTPTVLQALDEWIRRRLRRCLFK